MRNIRALALAMGVIVASLFAALRVSANSAACMVITEQPINSYLFVTLVLTTEDGYTLWTTGYFRKYDGDLYVASTHNLFPVPFEGDVVRGPLKYFLFLLANNHPRIWYYRGLCSFTLPDIASAGDPVSVRKHWYEVHSFFKNARSIPTILQSRPSTYFYSNTRFSLKRNLTFVFFFIFLI